MLTENGDERLVFGLDIGTRNVVGTVGYKDADDVFHVVDQFSKSHSSRAMLDGQIHDITAVGKTIMMVKTVLEKTTNQTLQDVCIAAAGRVLKTITTRVELEFDTETVVTSEHIHTLDLIGVDQAQMILNESNDTKFRFYSVGYSTIRYYANDDQMSNLVGHKVTKISEDIIVTFLPEDVVDGLYMAVGLAGMTVDNMTLEPIAAINIAIPKAYRMLNIALVDVGAGTSDISITKDGTIIAYGMIPKAGDELTEMLVQTYLVDFNTAEQMKIDSGIKDEITFEDILKIPHTIKSSEIIQTMQPMIDEMASDIANQIRALNGDESVSAVFVVGGGGRVSGFTNTLARELEIPPERVALRGEEVLTDVVFDNEDVKRDSLIVTPIGICLSAFDQKNNFIFVHFNGERVKLYDNEHLTVVDAVVQSGFPNEDLFPKSGRELRFSLNGKQRSIRGGPGEPAVITLNGTPASLGDPLEPNCSIEVVPSTTGEPAHYTVGQLEEYRKEDLCFMVNGRMVLCPKFAAANGELVAKSYEIKNDDKIELCDYYTIGQLVDFMDVELDMDETIYVNGKEADMDTEIFENFTVEWGTIENLTPEEEAAISEREERLKDILPGKPSEPQEFNLLEEMVPDEEEQGNRMEIIVNGSTVLMEGKDDYIFVDIFDKIHFDTTRGKGRSIVTKINGHQAQYTELLKPGDQVEIRWEDE